MSSAATAVTPLSAFSPAPGLGLATRFQAVPSQCSTAVTTWPSVWEPTAQMLFSARTSRSRRSFVKVLLGTDCHDVVHAAALTAELAGASRPPRPDAIAAATITAVHRMRAWPNVLFPLRCRMWLPPRPCSGVRLVSREQRTSFPVTGQGWRVTGGEGLDAEPQHE